MLGPSRFSFLNETRELDGKDGWNDPAARKLWLYNLHYFEDLNARGAAERREWHLALFRRWLVENPPGAGNGWEPYPTSLRIVNWIKWALGGCDLPEDVGRSLALQSRYLERNLEFHLLGNHLFANAKALVFAGAFFRGREADERLAKGLAILDREIPEQILSDGGHFERSPMYHCLILEDLLDLLNLGRAHPEIFAEGSGGKRTNSWTDIVLKMRRWLRAMSHPDGEIALLNDAAFEIAPDPMELEAYAARLGLEPVPMPEEGVTHLADSGYLRVGKGESVLFLDAALLGPDYLPGHGHADTLSFEWSLFGSRVLVDAGTSVYDAGPERLLQRSTKSHNTVVVDGQDSSEVWESFRVGRRARPFGLSVTKAGDLVDVTCSHDGYRRLPGKVIHRRAWTISNDRLRIGDSLEGRFRTARAGFLLHPDVAAASNALGLLLEDANGGEWALPSGSRIRWSLEAGRGRFEPARYHPGFGQTRETFRLVVDFPKDRNALELTWGSR